jgi:Kef-type K+ transport system membrane component KefB
MKNFGRFLLVVLMAGLMQAVHTVAPDARNQGSAVTLGIGFVLIVAWAVSRIVAQWGLPKLTGYMATGIAAGPFVLAYLDDHVVDGLSQVNGVAVALIALTAGSEINIRQMRPLLKWIAWIGLIAVIGTAITVAILTFMLRGWLSFTQGLSLSETAAIAAVIGTCVASGSPAVVVALRAETQADGPVARTVLGVVVLADLVVILLFAIASSIASAIASGEFAPDRTLFALAWELFGSMVIGVAVGGIFALALRVLERNGGADLFVLAVCLVGAEVGRRVHLDPLLLMLAAGMFVENATHGGERLRRAYEDASLPVFILFFTVVGASTRLDILAAVAVPALLLVAVRSLVLWGGTWVAAQIAGAPDVVRRFGGFGLMPQAGLSIALASLVARTFPGYGEQVSTLLLGMIALNELVMPVLFRIALVRSGEVLSERASAPAT